MQPKEMSVVVYGRRFVRQDWSHDLDLEAIRRLVENLVGELRPFGIILAFAVEEEICVEVKGYGDLLNAVRIRSPRDGLGNLCLGHIIGPSPYRDLLEDIRRGVNRVAFAPETVEPEASAKVVCHNCGCGC